MDILFEKQKKKLAYTSLNFVRSLMGRIEWQARLIGIKGARGTGKTTLLLQYIKKHLRTSGNYLYVSLDDIWFSENKLVALADDFVKQGGRHLFLDEVHKYPNWSQEIKNIYDDYPELQVVFTGSSLLEILNARADLSRRAITYKLQGLSFREYLNFLHGGNFNAYPLHEILRQHERVSDEILAAVRPLQHFRNYLKEGYYPFIKEIPSLYHARLEEVLNMIIEIELPLLRGVDITYAPKLRQLLLVISESAPFVPNISKLSERIGINRNTLVSYLHYLQEAGIILNLYKETQGISRLQKPDKVFLENTNIAYTVNASPPDMGNMRETFFANQLGYQHTITFPEKGDFLIDGNLLFETGGKNKTGKQTHYWPADKAFTAADGIEYGHGNRIPLWLFGFLY